MANSKSQQPIRAKRFGLPIIRSVAFIVVLLFLIWSAGSSGYASLLSTYAARSLSFEAADAAVSLNGNAENHLIRGGVWQAKGEILNAAVDYSRAAMLRPDDYVVWLNLAHARDLAGDKDAAIAAASRAVGLAPHYAKPHWQLGNVLVRAGRLEGGYGELRLAASQNPALLPAFIDLAWQLSEGDTQLVLAAVAPHEAGTYRALAGYFRKRGRPAEAVAMFKAAGREAGPEVVAERRAFLAELIGEKQFKLAGDLWAIAHPPVPDGPMMSDPDFENESDLDEPGFGWRTGHKSEEVDLSLDSSDARSGRLSLLVSFNGASDPAQAAVTQLVLVAPRTKYRLRYAVRTSELLSGSLPGIVVMDEGSGQQLGQSDPLPQTTDGWRDSQIEFTTSNNTEVINVRLQRKPCSGPCPIFGRLWLDSFSLQPVLAAAE